MGKRRPYAALWLCVDNSSLPDNATPRSTHALSSRKCHEPGMLRRVRHLRTVASLAPADLAAAEMAAQRSGENMSIAKAKGQVVAKSRPSVPLSEKMSMPHLHVAKSPPPHSRKTYRQRLSQRMKLAREHKGYSQADMAAKLGMSLDAYKKTEQRGALWSDLVEPFADAVNEDVLFILTGRRQKAPRNIPLDPPETPAQVA